MCDIFVTIPQDLARAMQPSDQLTDTLAMYEVILSDFGKYMTAIQDGTLALPAPSLPASDAGGAEPANDTLALAAPSLQASDTGGAETANGTADEPANDTLALLVPSLLASDADGASDTLALLVSSLPASDAGGASASGAEPLALPSPSLPASGAEPANGTADEGANDTGPARAGDFVCFAERRER